MSSDSLRLLAFAVAFIAAWATGPIAVLIVLTLAGAEHMAVRSRLRLAAGQSVREVFPKSYHYREGDRIDYMGREYTFVALTDSRSAVLKAYDGSGEIVEVDLPMLMKHGHNLKLRERIKAIRSAKAEQRAQQSALAEMVRSYQSAVDNEMKLLTTGSAPPDVSDARERLDERERKVFEGYPDSHASIIKL